MSVISRSHFELVRARKALEQAFEEGDWVALRENDVLLGKQLDAAFVDDKRNTYELLQEMERVLKTYANLVSALPASAAESLSFFPHNRS